MTVTTESPQVSTTLPRNALPYRVRFGLQESCAAYFRSFSEALEMAQQLRDYYKGEWRWRHYSVSLANHEREDNADEGYKDGLSEEQRAAWEGT